MSRMIAAMATLSVLGLGSASARAQDWRPPTDTERCPSRWGAGDERGSANLMTPEIVLRAARLIKAGEVIELAHPLFEGTPRRARAQHPEDAVQDTPVIDPRHPSRLVRQ